MKVDNLIRMIISALVLLVALVMLGDSEAADWPTHLPACGNNVSCAKAEASAADVWRTHNYDVEYREWLSRNPCLY